MRFYMPHTEFYCGIDLHARFLYLCVMDKNKKILVHRKLRNQHTILLLKLLDPYKKSIVVACESAYAWYWLADLCVDNGLEFILGHALYMKAIHGAKVKNDRIDSQKIAMLAQSGMFPIAYVYPRHKRAIRDLLRRRLYFVQERADLFCHIHLLNHQTNSDDLGRLSRSNYKNKNVEGKCEDPHTLKSLDADLKLLQQHDSVIRELEIYILEHTRRYYREELNIIMSIHGIGETIALTILYEMDSIERFNRVQEFISYCRLVKCTHESGGKKLSNPNNKIGNPHLRRIFAEAAVFAIKFNPEIKKYFEKLASKKGPAKAYGIIARKLAQAIYFMLKRKTVFNMNQFLAH